MTRHLTCLIRQTQTRLHHRHGQRLPSSSSRRLSSSSSSSQSRKSPTQSTTWERGAKLVKNTDVTNPYLDQVRSEVVDPALQLKTIEDELCGAIGKALGRQGEKVLFAIREMTEEHQRYLECMERRDLEEAVEHATRHNEARKRAVKARWELLVHRQAVGFIVDNHAVIHKTFPIGEELPVEMKEILTLASSGDDGEPSLEPEGPASPEKPANKVWGDQLSWWQTKGRWK